MTFLYLCSIMGVFKQIFRNRWLSAMNIAGLAIGLALSIMLLLAVTNELSFDKHFANSGRIVSLNSVGHKKTGIEHSPKNLRRAYTEVPEKIAGLEACTQIYDGGKASLIHKLEYFQGLELLFVDPEFFKVFQLTFIEGTPETALTNPKTLVMTRPYANLIFGNPNFAIGKTVIVNDIEYTIDAVVEPLPSNTHFSFDILGEIKSHSFQNLNGLEFYTFYLIDSEASVNDVRRSIEQAYSEILTETYSKSGNTVYEGETEMLTDLYLFSKTNSGLGEKSDIRSVFLLGGLSLIILLLAITNFMNLFLAQGETRMGEIGIRKANGAGIRDLVIQFFSEVSLTTLLAFTLGFGGALAIFFSFHSLREVALIQLISPWFIGCAIAVFVLTVILSSSYPSFYLSSFKPLDMLAKRIHFGKRRLSTLVIIFQSAVTIVLISYVLVVNCQISYMRNLPIGYNPKNVMMVPTNRTTLLAYESLKQELLRYPEIKDVSAATHSIGGGYSGQMISTPEDAVNNLFINEYRIMPGLGELMEIQVVDGRFFTENDPNNPTSVVLNEAAVRMLGIHPPYVGKEVIYKQRHCTIIGITKDFCYEELGYKIMPLVFSCYLPEPNLIYIRFNDNVTKTTATKVAIEVFTKFNAEYVLNPLWSEDFYNQKFRVVQTIEKVILFSSLLSLVIALMGLLAVQSFVIVRRTKEIGIRRIHGAGITSIVLLLTTNIAKKILIAGVIAIPIAYLCSSNWLNGYAYKISMGWFVFVIPIIIQCVLAILVILGVSYKVISTNPVESLKNE